MYPSRVRPRSIPGPTLIGSRPLDSLVYNLHIRDELPTVDLSNTLAKYLLQPTAYAKTVRLMEQYFARLVLYYRIGLALLVTVLFVPKSLLRDLMALTTVPASIVFVATGAFLSLDIARLLTRNYEFWFLSVMNLVNWVGLGVVVHDVRAVVCFSACLAYQTAILIDANYRTYPTAMASMTGSAPVVLGLGLIIAAHQIADGNYFEIELFGRSIASAADFMTFTTSTLMLFLVKLMVLKKTRLHQTFPGFKSIPCVVLKAVIHLEPQTTEANDRHRRRAVAPQTNGLRSHLHQQQLLVSDMQLTQIDAYRTVLPRRFWRRPPAWVVSQSRLLRWVFYGVGLLAWTAHSAHALMFFPTQLEIHKSLQEPNARSAAELRTHYRQDFDVLLATSSTVLTGIFCGTFCAFYQRDLLWLLVRNFDVVFSTVQMAAFAICLCDLNEWDYARSMNIFGWLIWYEWAITLDALTPAVKATVFHFQKRFAAPVITNLMMGVVAVGVVNLFVPELGLRDRALFHRRISSSADFVLTTKTVLLGRVVTITLWCSRQAYRLVTRKEDELNLIHASIEYISPYRTFTNSRDGTVAAADASLAVESALAVGPSTPVKPEPDVLTT